jgi:dipeptidyl aminopeptidase/acylaminoacyl peptidase
VVEASGGRPHPVAAFPDADNVIPNWSRDGRWLYFSSNHKGKVFQVWRIAVKNGVAVAGTEPVQVTKNGGNTSFESLDGRQLFYTKVSVRRTLYGAGLAPSTGVTGRRQRKNGAYFSVPSGASSEIEFLDFKTKRISHIAKLEKPSFYGFTVSPDGRSIVYSQWDRSEHNILVMKNFR